MSNLPIVRESLAAWMARRLRREPRGSTGAELVFGEQVALGIGATWWLRFEVKPGDRIEAAGVKIEAVPAYNIDPARLQAHPKANNWVGYVLQLGGNTYYHAGDTDHLPELDRIRTDVAFLPIGDGGYVMTVDEAAGMAKALKPKIAVPMHFGFFPGVGVPADGERFKKAAAPVEVKVFTPVHPFANK